MPHIILSTTYGEVRGTPAGLPPMCVCVCVGGRVAPQRSRLLLLAPWQPSICVPHCDEEDRMPAGWWAGGRQQPSVCTHAFADPDPPPLQKVTQDLQARHGPGSEDEQLPEMQLLPPRSRSRGQGGGHASRGVHGWCTHPIAPGLPYFIIIIIIIKRRSGINPIPPTVIDRD